ncbi:DUF6300 family protein [Streptomyces chrestomyceticus]|uniref:DUF6300 family protein n=1 Tax=Streptomyces chrestomyceticus TaxID=68185 RepID=UPI0035A8EAC6
MARVELSDRLPQCSRCRGDLITSVVMPQDDEYGRPIHLELCAACDADKSAAGALIRFFAAGGGHGRRNVRGCCWSGRRRAWPPTAGAGRKRRPASSEPYAAGRCQWLLPPSGHAHQPGVRTLPPHGPDAERHGPAGP